MQMDVYVVSVASGGDGVWCPVASLIGAAGTSVAASVLGVDAPSLPVSFRFKVDLGRFSYIAVGSARPRRQNAGPIAALATRITLSPHSGQWGVVEATVAVAGAGGSHPTSSVPGWSGAEALPYGSTMISLSPSASLALCAGPWLDDEVATSALMRDIRSIHDITAYKRTLVASLLWRAVCQTAVSLSNDLSKTRARALELPAPPPIPPNALSAANSALPSSAQHRGEQHWEVVDCVLEPVVPASVIDPPTNRFERYPVGEAIPHLASLLHTTGNASYGLDVKAPGGKELHAALVVSSEPHARVTEVDVSAALALDGVHGYFDDKDLAPRAKRGYDGDNDAYDKVRQLFTEKVFAGRLVTCVGHVMGIIVADTDELAHVAASLVKVTYQSLPPILSIEEAIAQQSFYPFDRQVVAEDEEAQVMATLAHPPEGGGLIDGEVIIGGQEHFYLEPHHLLAIPGEGKEMRIVSCTQCLMKTQRLVAGVLGIPQHLVTVETPHVGGAFGGKEVWATWSAGRVAVPAAKLGRPVRLALQRTEDMKLTGGRHPFTARYRVAYEPDGKIAAADITLYADCGNSTSISAEVLSRALLHVTNAYDFSCLRVRGFLCRTNLPSNGAFRGFGGPQAMVVAEAIIEHISRAISTRPEAVRLRNLILPDTVMPYGQTVHSDHMQRVWNTLFKSAEIEKRRAEIDAFNRGSRWQKRGLCILPTLYGISFPYSCLNQGSALVNVYTDGSVVVHHGGLEMGQGLTVKVAQVVARELGVSVDRIRVLPITTDVIANTPPTAASFGTDLFCSAALIAARRISLRLDPIRQRLGPTATLGAIASAAWAERISLTAHGFWASPTGGKYDWAANVVDNEQRGQMFAYYSFGAGAAEVVLDCLSGEWRCLRADVVLDAGSSLNPGVDIGQVEGAFLQGLGFLTMEELKWKDGHLMNASPHSYRIPTAADSPLDFRVSLLSKAHNPSAVHGSKAVGEPPLFLGAAVMFALRDAVMAARSDVDGGKEKKKHFDFITSILPPQASGNAVPRS